MGKGVEGEGGSGGLGESGRGCGFGRPRMIVTSVSICKRRGFRRRGCGTESESGATELNPSPELENVGGVANRL